MAKNPDPSGYDLLGYETKDGLKVTLNDATGVITIKGKTVNISGTVTISPPLAMKYVEGLVGKIKEIESRITKCEQKLENHEGRIKTVESKAHTH